MSGSTSINSNTSDTIINIENPRENTYELNNIINERIYGNINITNSNDSNSNVTLYNNSCIESLNDNFSLYIQRCILYFALSSSLVVLIIGILYVNQIGIFTNMPLGITLILSSITGIVFMISGLFIFIIISLFACCLFDVNQLYV